MSMSIDVSEPLRLAASFENAAGAVGGRVSKALRKTAFDIQSDAQILAPVDTGNLRDSISTDITGDGRFTSMAAEIGPTAEYGVHQEYGTSTQPGKPFMTPAFDRRYPPFEAALGQIAEDI